MRPRPFPPDHPPFAALPVQFVTVGHGSERMAVHVAGRLGGGRPAVVCIPGYHRNMSDFTEFVAELHRQLEPDWPVVLLDLLGRGRSADRLGRGEYVSTRDAANVIAVANSLALGAAILVGQGHGGQVAMALAAIRPALNAGTVLIDAGPVADPRGLVRLRDTLADLADVRGVAPFHRMTRQMLTVSYPGGPDPQLDRLALRTHFLDRRGRTRALFDPGLVRRLEEFEHDDVLVPQWPLFGALGTAPLLMMRTQLTDQLRREVFEQMMRRRRDAQSYVIEGQGSPALLDNADDVRPVAEFVREIVRWRSRFSNAAA